MVMEKAREKFGNFILSQGKSTSQRRVSERKINWNYNTPELIALKAGKAFQVTVTFSMFFFNEEGELFSKIISLKWMGVQKLL